MDVRKSKSAGTNRSSHQASDGEMPNVGRGASGHQAPPESKKEAPPPPPAKVEEDRKWSGNKSYRMRAESPAPMEAVSEMYYDYYMEEGEGYWDYGVSEEIPQKPAIFVHSPPTQFPDVLLAKKSTFRSIFVKTAVPKESSSYYKRQVPPESQFNMVPVLEDPRMRSDTTYRKDPVQRAFEKRGVIRDLSNVASSQWDVFPITKSGLFSFHSQDRVHQTRHLSKIEERLSTAQVQVLKFAHSWPTGSSWTGHWDGLGMAGSGTYTMPHDVTYIGKMQDGVCHDDDATLIYPNGFKVIHCNYVNGVLTDYQFQFPDGLEYEKNWKYCRYPDRRFWNEILNGLKPGKVAQKTQEDPPRKIPPGCYDTNDGFFNEKTRMLTSPDDELLRVPTCQEEKWIKEKCRKGFQQFTRFRPDLFENWFNNDKEFINSILEMQRRYNHGKITYEELYQFYDENDLLTSCVNFKKMKRQESTQEVRKMEYKLKKRYEGECFVHLKSSTHARKLRSDRFGKRISSMGKSSWKMRSGMDAVKSPTMSTITSSVGDRSKSGILRPRSSMSAHERRASFKSQGTQSRGDEDTISHESREHGWNEEKENKRGLVEGLILDIIEGIALQDLEKCKTRLVRTQSFGNLQFRPEKSREKCFRVLQSLYTSLSDAAEYCDSTPEMECDFKMLAEDRYQTVKYWGKKIFTLSFNEKAGCGSVNF
ncbi:UNVERIFIED_CONTAM: hypothetical protein PYX00_007764 [Menopon gallinae]|uniref:EF-hand domain-containing protein n=1 Tax=Menopon gallinae TaxID=328185 RepID=A0AAW2HK22_9NEOP